jgi:hypothetical protein
MLGKYTHQGGGWLVGLSSLSFAEGRLTVRTSGMALITANLTDFAFLGGEKKNRKQEKNERMCDLCIYVGKGV